MNNDMIAAEHIAELEAQLEDAYVKIDLITEAYDEEVNKNRVLTAELQRRLNGQKVEYGAA